MQRAPSERAVFGRFLLLEQLAQGGMAQIWRARPAAKEAGAHELVVKTLLPRLVGQPLFTELFAAEARITQLLSHPGIARVVDHGAVKGMPYLAMERIDGWDLSTLYRALPAGRRIPVEVALAIGVEMCRAVGHAHAWRDKRGTHRPIVHGDLSPSNLMVRRDGGVTLIDFGVAHMDARRARARAHVVIGKSGYLAPELLDGAVASPRSDVFSAGVVLHELLVGRHLFAVDSERETLRRLTEATVPPPSQSNPQVSPALDAVVLRALDRDPARRFASAAELAEALDRIESPWRASRSDVAAFVVPLCARVRRSEGPATTPIAPSVPATAARMAALPMAPVWHESTGTINERPRRWGPVGTAAAAHALAARAEAAPAAGRRRARRHLLLAFAVVIAAMLAPVPRAPADWSPLDALDTLFVPPIVPSSVSPIVPSNAAANAPSSKAARPPADAPLPLSASPPAASPRSPPAARSRHHHRSRSSVARGSLVDPFHSR